MANIQEADHRIGQVKQEVLDAFSKLGLPRRNQIIGPPQGDKAGERRIQRELAGKEWLSLDAKFLGERWPAFCYLSAEGYRYYLPALLMKCLDDFSEQSDLVHSMVFALAPSYWHLYYRGQDEDFIYQTSLFNAEQYGAVCSFLGLAFDLLPWFQYHSAQALKWGWNKQPHPALDKCREYFARLHHYQYPPSSDPQVRSLIEQIRAAFKSTPYPGDNQLCGSDQGDEPAQCALALRGLNWQAIHPQLLAYEYTSLSFLTNEGFRYFLPAYLVADLMEDELKTNTNMDPVFHLTNGLAPDSTNQRQDRTNQRNEELIATGLLSDEVVAMMKQDEQRDKFDWYQIAIDKFSHFNLEERKAIIAYLKYRAADEDSADEINEALDKYWLKSIA